MSDEALYLNEMIFYRKYGKENPYESNPKAFFKRNLSKESKREGK